jgi:hypothetical protein
MFNPQWQWISRSSANFSLFEVAGTIRGDTDTYDAEGSGFGPSAHIVISAEGWPNGPDLNPTVAGQYEADGAGAFASETLPTKVVLPLTGMNNYMVRATDTGGHTTSLILHAPLILSGAHPIKPKNKTHLSKGPR